MKMLLCFVLLIQFISLHALPVDVTAFGARPNSFTDATPFVRKAIAACPGNKSTILLFPKGRYDFWPSAATERNYYISNSSSAEECPSKVKRIGLFFENKKHIVIEGDGSLFVFHGKMITFSFDHCDHIRLQNLELDFERPTMSEMTIDTVSDSSITASIHPDSKYAIIDGRLQWYGEGWGMHNFHAILVNRTDSTMKYSSWDPFNKAKATALTTNKVRFTGEFKKQSYPAGAVLTVRDPVRDHVGMFIYLSKNISVTNVQLHYMHGLGIISQFSENLSFDSVEVTPSHNRMIAAFADCLHFSGCRGFILIRHCHFNGSHDDPVNVHGTQLRITAKLSSNSVRLKFMHAQTYGFPAYYAGDTVNFVHGASLHTYASAIVAEAKLVSEKEMMLRFTKPLPANLQKDDCLENITWTPSLTIQHCLFEATNTRGLLVTTPRKVIIDSNVFSKTGMYAILIADDASSWFESGAVHDVSITNNSFINCGYNLGENNYTIAIAPENHLPESDYYVHSNIRIERNHFITAGSALLTARSTTNLIFSNNTIQQSAGGTQPALQLTACDKVKVLGNSFANSNPVIGLKSMAATALESDIKNIEIQAGK